MWRKATRKSILHRVSSSRYVQRTPSPAYGELCTASLAYRSNAGKLAALISSQEVDIANVDHTIKYPGEGLVGSILLSNH